MGFSILTILSILLTAAIASPFPQGGKECQPSATESFHAGLVFFSYPLDLLLEVLTFLIDTVTISQSCQVELVATKERVVKAS
jgi:hypothetical protein